MLRQAWITTYLELGLGCELRIWRTILNAFPCYTYLTTLLEREGYRRSPRYAPFQEYCDEHKKEHRRILTTRAFDHFEFRTLYAAYEIREGDWPRGGELHFSAEFHRGIFLLDDTRDDKHVRLSFDTALEAINEFVKGLAERNAENKESLL
jgi:hypothetical protein